MEQQNSNTNSPVLCRAGCGFYGSSSMDGMCSKCYKEALNRKMQPPTSGSQSSSSAPVQISSPSDRSSQSSFRDLNLNSSSSTASSPMPTSLLSASMPAFSTAHLAKPSSSVSLASSGASADSALSTSPSSSSLPGSYDPSSPLGDSAKKKNRCAECNKKVGLTAGFECRCGGMFCSLHRYSDMHKCSFDYKQMGAEEVRKNNPAVRGEKVQKL